MTEWAVFSCVALTSRLSWLISLQLKLCENIRFSLQCFCLGGWQHNINVFITYCIAAFGVLYGSLAPELMAITHNTHSLSLDFAAHAQILFLVIISSYLNAYLKNLMNVAACGRRETHWLVARRFWNYDTSAGIWDEACRGSFLCTVTLQIRKHCRTSDVVRV